MNNLREIIKLEDLDLSGIKVNETLNPKFFDQNEKLYPKIKDNLLKIVEKYKSHVGLDDLFIQDIVMTGSLANYNYNENSDVDVHILSDYSKFNIEPEILVNLFKEKKDSWADKYDITIYNHPVELYVEDETTTKKKNWVAMYSILNDNWLQKPSLDNIEIDYETLSIKSEEIASKIDEIISKHSSGNINDEKALSELDKLKDKIKDLRDEGLNKKHSELALENLIFKVLRNNGYLDKMNDLKKEIYNKEFSMKENKNKRILVIRESQYNKLCEALKRS